MGSGRGSACVCRVEGGREGISFVYRPKIYVHAHVVRLASQLNKVKVLVSKKKDCVSFFFGKGSHSMPLFSAKPRLPSCLST